MLFLLAIPVFVLGALGRRIAGGVLNEWFRPIGPRVMGDTPARLIFGASIGLSALLGGAPWYLALALVPVTWVGTTTGNFDSLSMGRGAYSISHDILGMLAHGALTALTPTVLLASLDYFAHIPSEWWWITLSCVQAPCFYLIGWTVTEKLGSQGVPPSAPALHRTALPVGFRGGVELAEALWGGAMALGAYAAFVA